MMTRYSNSQEILQLPKRQGGYPYILIAADIVNQFEKKRATRFILTLDETVSCQRGLNHLGDGNFFFILSNKNLKPLKKGVGDFIHFEMTIDPNPLGVDVPEVLNVLLTEDDNLKTIYDNFTDGKKRALIFWMLKFKNLDQQVQTAIDFLNEHQYVYKKKQKN